MHALSLITLVAGASAHSIFQQLSVNGVSQGQLTGVRSPAVNNPVYDVTSEPIVCNTGLVNPVSTTVIDIPAGAKVGAYWQHILGGPQGAGDADNPIATTHHGPISYYLAKVPNSATASGDSLSWFKVASDGLNTATGKWGVDNMVANAGWAYFTMPSCIAPGNYLLRVELIALHSAYASKGAQFYGACSNINIVGSGSFTPSTTVSFPGAYAQNDPAILINIYGPSGQPDNGGKPYTAPGPAPIVCPAGGSTPTSTPVSIATTLVTKTSTSSAVITTSKIVSTTTTKTTSSVSTSASGAPLYGQCGGIGWQGPTTCASGTCKASGAYYSQCT
ncbi:hypothetical protein MMC25_005690 [Agyrium rufum]|nr:hypothetical protein [Agyrium rufum]